MRILGLSVIGLALVAVAAPVPVMAQPIIIPLQPQKQDAPPAVSSPPVAPPMAGPSLPSTTDVAGQSPVVDPQEETASQPAP